MAKVNDVSFKDMCCLLAPNSRVMENQAAVILMTKSAMRAALIPRLECQRANVGEVLQQLLACCQWHVQQSPTGVPKPVTASQPSKAGKPVVLQPSAEPLVISVKPLYPLA